MVFFSPWRQYFLIYCDIQMVNYYKVNTLIRISYNISIPDAIIYIEFNFGIY